MGLKLTIIGAGSVYTAELIEGLIKFYDKIPIDILTLMDINFDRLNIINNLAIRMFEQASLPITVQQTMQRAAALEDANYIIIQIRVGGTPARILDERIPLKFGIIGQETTGPGGFANALRTIPVVLDIARDIENIAPHAIVLNFTNPAGIITEALLRYTKLKVYGLCNVPFKLRHEIAKWLGIPAERIRLRYIGLNHLSWITRVELDNGEDVTEAVLNEAINRATKGEFPFTPDLLETLGMIPSYYLRYYYYHDEIVKTLKNSKKTRAEEVQQINEKLYKIYANPQCKATPELLSKRGGTFYSTAAISLLASMQDENFTEHVLNITNQHALVDLPNDCVVEIPVLVSKEKLQYPAPCRLPLTIRGLVQAVKAYEQLTIEAAVEGNERKAIMALLTHPLVPSFNVARKLWKALKRANKSFWPQFFGA